MRADVQRAVPALDLPVHATGKHLAAQRIPFHFATDDGHVTTFPIRPFAQGHQGRNASGDTAQMG